MKLATVLFSLLFTLPGFGQSLTTPLFVKNLSAPPVGITSSSVILLWDDYIEPDLLDNNYSDNPWTYEIYQDGIQIGSTLKRSFTVKNLLPDHTYKFTVGCNKNTEKSFLDANTIQITTEKAGKILNVKQFGAAGDGKKMDTEAIQKAIIKCEKGGTVLIPAGTYLVGRLELKSDMTLEIAKDALVIFNGYDGTLQYQGTRASLPGLNGDIGFNSHSLIFGFNLHNLTITGEGTLDGNGETWWPTFTRGIDQIKGVRRPFFLVLAKCSDILIQGITFQDPPMHNNAIFNTEDIIYSEVKFLKFSTIPGRNGDALDPYACRNMIITGCTFGNQDDSIALKGNDNYLFNEYISIRDCVFDGNAAPGASPLGFNLGSGTKVRHLVVKNCEFIDAASLANIKTNRTRLYTCVEDVRVENITYTNTKHTDRWFNRAPISIDQFYYAPPSGDPNIQIPEGTDPTLPKPLTPETPVYRNIQFRNITINNPAGRGIYISGYPESPVQQVSFTNIRVSSKDGVSMQNVKDIAMHGIEIIQGNDIFK